MRIMGVKEFIETGEEDKITNFTVDNKCSNCGQCCNALLPLSTKELRVIRSYVNTNKIKAYKNVFPTSRMSIDLSCPFRNNTTKACMIYPVRPEICKSFICNDSNYKVKRKEIGATRKIINLRDIFE